MDLQQLNKAQKSLRRAQLIGIVIYVILAIAKRKFFWEYQLELITILALINAIMVFKDVIFLAKNKQYISNYKKARLLLWVAGAYAVLLLLLSVLELYIKHSS